MPITLIGSNLNLYGDGGNFETDPSTWGFTTDYYNSRYSADKVKDNYSCKSQSFGADFSAPSIFNPNTYSVLVQGKMLVNPSRKYIASAWVKTDSANVIAPSDCFFKVDVIYGTLYTNVIASITKTVSDATDTWVKLVFQFDTNGDGGSIPPPAAGTVLYLNLYIDTPDFLTEHINYMGIVKIDQFEIFEYTDEVIVTDDLAFDIPSCVVTDDSGSSDGSISVATTGGIGAKLYSKDAGVSWQSSNVFSGLAHGTYTILVKDSTDFTISHDFVVNLSGAPFSFTTSVVDETVSGANNGQITVSVLGATGPYTFSKDGGVTYQSSNVFSDLPPGSYNIYVKDSGAIILGAIVTVHAGAILFEKIWFSKNTIFFQASADPGWDALINPRVFNEITVDENSNGIYLSRLKTDLPPDSDGNVIFYNREAFTNSLKAVPPSLNDNTILRLTDRIKLFKNNIGQLQGDEINPVSTTPSLPHLVLLGGLSKFQWASIDYFINYLPTNKKFLSWAPTTKMVDAKQEDYLTYFVFGKTTTSLKLLIKAYYDDGTNQTATIITAAPVQYGQLYQIPAGPSNTGAALINAGKNLLKYDLWLTNQSDAVISEVRTYVLDKITNPRKRLFMFLNSLGGFEVLRFTGIGTNSVVIGKTEIAKFLPHNYNALDGEFESNDNRLRESNSFSSGYLKDDDMNAWAEYLEDFLLSARVFNVTDGRRIPIRIQPATYEINADQNFERFVRFTAVGAYEDENYTPKKI